MKASMKNKKTKGLWRGLSAIFAFVMCLFIVAGQIMEGYATTIDQALGTVSQSFVSESTENDPLYDKYVPDDKYLNADGTGNSEALVEAAIDLNRREVAEGVVLLKNENNALPLKAGNSVTMLGIRSVKTLLGQGMGSYAKGAYVSLAQALGGNRTDFAHTIADLLGMSILTDSSGNITYDYDLNDTISGWSGSEYDFDGGGLNVNPTMIDIYTKINSDRGIYANNERAAEVYDPNEPTPSDLAAVDGSYQSSFAQYGDAVIVVLGRPSAEQYDFMRGGVATGTGADEPLALTTNERDIIKLAEDNFDKVIVLLNTTNTMEVRELNEDPNIDAIVWIGFPGCYGNLGVADVLTGKVSPSGGLADTFATHNLSAPSTQNIGYYTYENVDEVITRGDSTAYTIEAEGIYTGYKYYETRYYDAVLGQGNATSAAGATVGNTWDYDAEVIWPFGYGMSYTTFDMSLDGAPQFDISTNADTGATEAIMTVNVKVTNTGRTAGKTPVQIYGQAPYTKGGVEKSAIQLLAYEKTSELAPGASETVPVACDLQYMASYDSEGAGTYIMDPGDYYFAVGNGAHDALNNILALQGYTEEDGMYGEGDEAAAYKQTINESFLSKTAFSISKTGYKIENQLENADWNYFQPGEVTYLSRSDWSGTWPKDYQAMALTNSELIDLLNGHYYTLHTDDDTSDIKWELDNGMSFYEMYDVDFDDPLWNDLLDQMTLEEAMYISTYGGPMVPGADSIGIQEAYITENAATGIALALTSNQDMNSPWAINPSDPNAVWYGCVFASAPNIAATFNHEIQYELGEFIGIESMFMGIPILWGPGLNTHRSAYNGRNGEYYSEDPVLTGTTAMEFAIGALSNGLIAAPKHFAFNDQETNRKGIAPYMTEQKAREGDLRAFQIAFEAHKYDTDDDDVGMLGVMTSFSKIGPVEVTCNKNMVTNILQNEWGFKGYCVTDIYDDMDLYPAVLNSGITCYDTRGMSGFYGNTTLENTSNLANQVDGSKASSHMIDGDANLQESVKNSAHMNLYAWSESNLMNRYNSTTRIEKNMVWWRGLYYAGAIISGILMLICLVFCLLPAKKKEEEA